MCKCIKKIRRENKYTVLFVQIVSKPFLLNIKLFHTGLCCVYFQQKERDRE